MIVSVDTSRKGIGAILTQKQKETDDSGKEVLRERVIAYASKKLKEGENHYSSFKLELMGMVYALHVWRYFLLANTGCWKPNQPTHKNTCEWDMHFLMQNDMGINVY